MAFPLTDLNALDALPFDTVIDVRSPAEYAEDHVPGAISLPALSNAQRAEVGTIYVQDSPFRARKLGAAMVARNAAAHIEGPLAGKDGGWQPLVYCWRGGQRSGSFTSILTQIGWRAQVLQGGYQSYRRLIVRALYEEALTHRFVLLDGNTGTGKTELLHMVAARGGQVLDLEGLANHRGSLLGARAGGQPGQKGFETSLAARLRALDPARTVLVEAESSKIGKVILPPMVWAAMQSAPRLHLRASAADRAAYLARTYAELSSDPAELQRVIGGLVPYQGHERVGAWQALITEGAFRKLALELITRHYDSRYAKSRERLPAPAATLDLTLDARGMARAADAIAAHLEAARL
ncbi:tRNA 2-selenouridine(34) synthase MnmH [Alphaproteobacteria bacterium KMM 3653]|uniref:tRNA 2-selenouridine(34) synthase MnmH n=1 Tax=Harenicola maris TaxID=2841044 RepID=A0AAP2CPU0_9RHOB|nr:tRNA 2-selenouridine(34) synthase MnmH [Harenicola maris]